MKRVNSIPTYTRVALALGVACLTACTPQAPSVPTVEYYRAHKAERRIMVRACTNDPGQARDRADCANALAAESLEGLGSLRDLPPLALPVPDSHPTPPAP